MIFLGEKVCREGRRKVGVNQNGRLKGIEGRGGQEREM